MLFGCVRALHHFVVRGAFAPVGPENSVGFSDDLAARLTQLYTISDFLESLVALPYTGRAHFRWEPSGDEPVRLLFIEDEDPQPNRVQRAAPSPRPFQSVRFVFPGRVKPHLSCERCRGLIRRIPTRFYSVL